MKKKSPSVKENKESDVRMNARRKMPMVLKKERILFFLNFRKAISIATTIRNSTASSLQKKAIPISIPQTIHPEVLVFLKF